MIDKTKEIIMHNNRELLTHNCYEALLINNISNFSIKTHPIRIRTETDSY